jgi:hypothetical protein
MIKARVANACEALGAVDEMLGMLLSPLGYAIGLNPKHNEIMPQAQDGTCHSPKRRQT